LKVIKVFAKEVFDIGIVLQLVLGLDIATIGVPLVIAFLQVLLAMLFSAFFARAGIVVMIAK